MLKRIKGFTLIELLVVIIIVAILAAVSVPLMRGNVLRAKASEAIAALGSIRTQMRLILAEQGTYNASPPGVTVGLVERAGAAGEVPGFSPGDLTGTYFSEGDYRITAVAASTFVAQAAATIDGSAITITINQVGSITELGI